MQHTHNADTTHISASNVHNYVISTNATKVETMNLRPSHLYDRQLKTGSNDMPAMLQPHRSIWPVASSIALSGASLVQRHAMNKENKPLWQGRVLDVSQAQKSAVLAVAPSLNVQRLRPRPSMDVARCESVQSRADTASNASVEGRDVKKRKSVRKRVMSKVKDGLLSRTKSTLKISGSHDAHIRDETVRVDYLPIRYNTTSKSGRFLQQQPSQSQLSLSAIQREDTPSPPCSGDLTLSMLHLDSTTSLDRCALAENLTPDKSKAGGQIECVRPVQHGRTPQPVKMSPAAKSATQDRPVYVQLTSTPNPSLTVDAGTEAFWVTVAVKVIGACGNIMNLILTIEPGVDGHIHDVVGQMNVASLHSTEQLDILVRVSLRKRKSRMTRNDSCQSISSNFDVLCSELETMLGDWPAELFTVKARYAHSLFPINTTLALELNYTRRTRGRNAFAASTVALIPVTQFTTHADEHETPSPRSFIEPREQHSPARSETSLTDPSEAGSEERYHSPPPSPDAARAIWHHMRRDSKPVTEALNIASSDGSEAEDKALVAMKQKALMNKRSVGAETLRDWHNDTRPRKEDSCPSRRRDSSAPWL